MNFNEEYLKNIPNMLLKDNDRFKVVNKDGIISLVRNNNFKSQKFFRKIGFKVPNKSFLELDEYSSFVFRNIDGTKTVEDIGVLLKKKYGDDCEPLNERLSLFLEHLKNDKKWIEFKER